MNSETKICVIGLGYVGLPLARLFSTKYETVGFDMNRARVDALNAGHDATLEVSDELLQSALANGRRSKSPTSCCSPRSRTAFAARRTSRTSATAISTSSPCPRPWTKTAIPT